MNILITGAEGQLGSEIKDQAQKYHRNYNFFYEGSKGLDITNKSDVSNYIRLNDISLIINCAAYTSVDRAESEENIAFRVNEIGVRNLISAIKEKSNGRLIHISTDYVFDGKNEHPYKELDKVNPIGVYGRSKRAGEELIINSNIDGVIIRTSWLYSKYGSNFVKTMLRLGKERDSINVVNDQIGAPTYARDLAKTCLSLINKPFSNKDKIYHYSNSGKISWYDFAKEIMNLANLNCKVLPVETKDYPTPAERPKFSVMNTIKIKEDFSIEIQSWKDSLKECILEINKKPI